MTTTQSSTEATPGGGEKTWSFNQKDSDPAFSDERWTQFTKGGGPPKEGTSPGNNSSSNNKEVGTASSAEKNAGTNGGGTSAAPATQPVPVATSPLASDANNVAAAAGKRTTPPAAVTSSAPAQGAPGVGGNEATILYPVGTGANGAPLFMAITPSQLAATGGNPQLLLAGGGAGAATTTGGNGVAGTPQAGQSQIPPPLVTQAPPQQQPAPLQVSQQVGAFTATQQILGTPHAGGGPQLGTPMAGTPNPASNPVQQSTINPSQAGVQMVVPPGMSIPVPVPLSTIHVKTAVGTPKYTGTNIPQPAPLHGMQQAPIQGGTPHAGGAPPLYGPPPGMMTPTLATPTLLQLQPGGGRPAQMVMTSSTPPGMSPMRGGPQAVPLMHPGAIMQPQQPGHPQQQQLQTVDEQQVWAANEHLFKQGGAPALANPSDSRSQSTATRSQDVTPQAGSVRAKLGGERSNGPTPKGLSSRATPQSGDDKKGKGGKMSRQEMLMQQLEARDPSTTLPAPKPVETDDLLTDDEKRKRREELEERLVGRREDELTPQASAMPTGETASPPSASTPVAAWKGKPCKSFVQTGQCKYGDKCVFAHGGK